MEAFKNKFRKIVDKSCKRVKMWPLNIIVFKNGMLREEVQLILTSNKNYYHLLIFTTIIHIMRKMVFYNWLSNSIFELHQRFATHCIYTL
jgi:hypothetical protein